jgi:bacteriocin-like protein
MTSQNQSAQDPKAPSIPQDDDALKRCAGTEGESELTNDELAAVVGGSGGGGGITVTPPNPPKGPTRPPTGIVG